MKPPVVHAAGGFGVVDWGILVAYLLAMLALGVWFARRQKTVGDYFLAGRRMPVWAVAISIVATSVSAVTFIGAPEDAYTGNLTYLTFNLAGLIAVIIVAVFFIPAFYRHNVTTVYQLLDHRFGPAARLSTSAMFMIGRIFASGARLFVAAIPFSLIAFGDLERGHLFLAIGIVTAVATAYTMVGGLHAVIWTEVPQTALFLGAAIVAGWLLLDRIPLAPGEIVSALAESKAADGSGKLTLFDWRTDPTLPFSMWSVLLGMTLFNMAVYGADQDLAQRILACRTAIKGAWSAILSNLIGLVVAVVFLSIGLLLFIYHRRPDLMGSAAPGGGPPEGRQVFLQFILEQTPTGLRGLMIAGVFAAAMSSLASALSAMASTAICDFYRPLRPGRSEAHYLRASRLAVLAWGGALCAFACLCVGWQRKSGEGLLPFAIGVMIFAYTGLLAVFLAAIFTRRGSPRSVVAALIVGFIAVVAMKFGPDWEWLPDRASPPRLSLGWQMFIGTALAFFTCIAARGRPVARNDLRAPSVSDGPSRPEPNPKRRMTAAHDIDALIGRMLMVGVRGSSMADSALHEDLEACRGARIGGVILFDADLPAASALMAQGVPREQALARSARNIVSPDPVRTLCATLREALGDDLLIAVDQEGGAVARLSPARGFEPSVTAAEFAGLDAEGRVREARRLAREVARSGFNVNFAPCVDVAVNPENPIIAGRERAFSSDPRLVAACGATVVDALHEVGVAACLKHFPGHGSSRGDTHEGFTDVTGVYDERTERLPYELLLRLPPPDARADMVMTGHLFDARVDPHHPASLSRRHTTDILRGVLSFDGVVIVDSLDMGAVTSRYGPEEALILAVNAGADILLDCNNAPGPARACPAAAMHEAIARALRDGRIDGGAERLRISAARIDGLLRCRSGDGQRREGRPGSDAGRSGGR